jgi:transposase
MSRMGQVVDLRQVKEQREREQRKVDPKRQAWVREIAQHHPEWGPKELEKLHQELDAWGE